MTIKPLCRKNYYIEKYTANLHNMTVATLAATVFDYCRQVDFGCYVCDEGSRRSFSAHTLLACAPLLLFAAHHTSSCAGLDGILAA